MYYLIDKMLVIIHLQLKLLQQQIFCIHCFDNYYFSYDDKTLKHGQYANPNMLYNSVLIGKSNPGITKLENCNNCGLCKRTCTDFTRADKSRSFAWKNEK